MFWILILLPYIINITDNTPSEYSKSETELLHFSTLKPFNIEPRKKVSGKKYTQYLCQPKDVLFKQLLVKAAGVNWWVL